MIVQAQYVINTYTVTFVDWDGTILKSETVEYLAQATAPNAPLRTNYTFVGWDKEFLQITQNLTVVALYELRKVTITYNTMGGT